MRTYCIAQGALLSALCSVQFSRSVVSNSLWPHELQHARLPCPSTARVHSDSCPLSWWCHPTISSSVIPFSSCPQCFPASRSFPMSQLFALAWQIIGVSTSTLVLPMNIFICKIVTPMKLWALVRYLANFLAGYEGDSLALFSHCFFLLSFSSLPGTHARPKLMKLRPWCLIAKIHWETKW